MVLFSLIVEQGHRDDLDSFSLLCWSLWFVCNMKVFHEKSESYDNINARGERIRSMYHLITHSFLLP